ncbi:MAG TPA: hypothetical protein PKO15_01100 [Fibrobacteria bacterium]|mgnify:CR=1 FL=1|nr:hypothetical protein [Fibrobacteria bacterium]HOX50691.1 hypothetical protein [Fibrobacteria bacterium]
MSRNLLTILIGLAGTVFAQYNDYPTGEYEYSKNRIVFSPVKMVGGMDPAKRDEGPKVNISWVPNIDIIDVRYERILGIEGSIGVGPLATYYGDWAGDSVKATAWAAGLYGRYYLDLAQGGYVQFSAQWYSQTGAKVRNGSGFDTLGNPLAAANVDVSGPQFSPVLGYSRIFNKHLVLEGQMGFTIGNYDRQVTGSPVITHGKYTIKTYESNADWGGFYFAQIALGLAW